MQIHVVDSSFGLVKIRLNFHDHFRGPKRPLNDPQPTPKWLPTTSKRSPKDPQTIPKQRPSDPQTIPKSVQFFRFYDFFWVTNWSFNLRWIMHKWRLYATASLLSSSKSTIFVLLSWQATRIASVARTCIPLAQPLGHFATSGKCISFVRGLLRLRFSLSTSSK